jgi:enoyl-CoA hydratase/carnithine racemase
MPQTARAARQSPILLRETLGSIAVLTLNRPRPATACRKRLIAELHAALNEIRDDKTCARW